MLALFLEVILMAETLTDRPAYRNAFLNAAALHLLKPSMVGWPEEGEAAVEPRSPRRQAVVDRRTVQLLKTGGFRRSSDADLHSCHDGAKPMDGKDSQSPLHRMITGELASLQRRF